MITQERWFLPVIAKWAVTLDWLPVIGPLEMIASFHGWKAAAVIAVIGLIGGMWLTRIPGLPGRIKRRQLFYADGV